MFWQRELDKFWEFQKKEQLIVYFGPCNLYADYWRLHHPLSLFVDFYIFATAVKTLPLPSIQHTFKQTNERAGHLVGI